MQLSIWRTFSAAPHRVMFFAGGLQGILALAWWLADLGGRYGGFYPPIAWTLPPIWGHAFLMLYGFFPFFIFGFLMTAAPNWVNGGKVEARFYVPAFFGMAGGIALFYAGLALAKPLAELGVALYLAGFLIGWYALLKIVALSPHPDKRHALTVIAVVFVGWLGAAAYLAWLLGGSYAMLRFAVFGGLWFFLLPTFVSVSHRMIPFFSSVVLPAYTMRRPYWALFALLGGMLAHGLLELNGGQAWLWLADAPMALVALYLSLAWRIAQSFQIRLLAVLHLGFFWLFLALALYSAQSLLVFVSGRPVLGMAPLHALTIGYFASMVLGMVSRVTLGHSGRPLVADTPTWLLFLAFQATALLRILADTPLVFSPGAFYLLAAAVWLACFSFWGLKYLPAYLRPRVDGKEG
ncbi:MAG: NnrS family protein [Sulfuricellaceae bacterium]|nr:NnrS family protein [Sulfuricellaceae bacterium]